MLDKYYLIRMKKFWADSTASDNQGSAPPSLSVGRPSEHRGIPRPLTSQRRKGEGKGLAPCTPGPGLPAGPQQEQGAFSGMPRAGSGCSLGGDGTALLLSHRLCKDVGSRWQWGTLPAGLTEPHLPGNSLQFQGIPPRCSHPQPG